MTKLENPSPICAIRFSEAIFPFIIKGTASYQPTPHLKKKSPVGEKPVK